MPSSLCAFHGMRCCLWPLSPALRVGCEVSRQSVLQLQRAYSPLYRLLCLAPQFIKEETQRLMRV